MGKHQGMASTLTFANRVGTEICDAVRDLYNSVSDEGSEFDGDDDSYSAVSKMTRAIDPLIIMTR